MSTKSGAEELADAVTDALLELCDARAEYKKKFDEWNAAHPHDMMDNWTFYAGVSEVTKLENAKMAYTKANLAFTHYMALTNPI